MIRHPLCDNDNCQPDGGQWRHAPECPAGWDAQGAEDMAVSTAREDSYSTPFVPAQRDWRWAA